MAASKTNLVNKALTKVGAQPIINLDDDTERARVVNRVYESSLKAVLGECKWNFATKRKDLTAVTDELDWYYTNEAYVYQKPLDMIRIFGASDDNAMWREEGDYIISDTSGLGLLYVYFLDDPTKYSSLFIDALTDKLCADIAYSIVNSASLGDKYELKYKEISLPKAMAANSQAGTQVVPQDNAWVDAKDSDAHLNA